MGNVVNSNKLKSKYFRYSLVKGFHVGQPKHNCCITELVKRIQVTFSYYFTIIIVL